MLKLNTLLKIFTLLVSVYLIFCIAVYSIQKSLLFPAYVAKPVPADWQPKGRLSQHALINGNCGKLHVAIWRTPNAKGTLMMFHGNGESLASIDDYAQKFHDLGYDLMAWDYPGYGQSTGCWHSQEMLLADAESTYQWLSTKESPEKIYIFGYSIGTGMALSLAAQHQDNPVYLVSAYDSLANVAKDKISSIVPISLLLRYPMQTKKWVDAIHQPIYLMHGSQDVLIRPERALSFVKQTKANVKVEWVAQAGHADDVLFAYRNSWLKRLLP